MPVRPWIEFKAGSLKLKTGSQSGAIFSTSACTNTKAVICNGQRHTETLRINKMNSIMEAISWICAYFQVGHDRISDFSLVIQETQILEAQNCDIDVPCVLQMEYAVVLCASHPCITGRGQAVVGHSKMSVRHGSAGKKACEAAKGWFFRVAAKWAPLILEWAPGPRFSFAKTPTWLPGLRYFVNVSANGRKHSLKNEREPF